MTNRLIPALMTFLLCTAMAIPAFAGRVKLAAVGDVFFGRAGQEFGGNDPFQYVASIFKKHDIVLGNLETPIIEERRRVLDEPCSLGKGTCETPDQLRYRRLYYLTFQARLAAARILKSAGFTVLSTANNHAEDQGNGAILETRSFLENEGLTPVGTGSTVEEAWKPLIIEQDGIRIGIIAATAIRNFDSKGKQAFYAFAKMPRMFQVLPPKVRALKQRVDFVVVTLHYGMEDHQMAALREQKLMKMLSNAGADLFIGHHPHVLRGIEVIGQMVVFYSMGNFLFDKNRDLWGESGIAHVDFVKDGDQTTLENVALTPVLLDGDPGKLPRPLEGEEAKRILKKVKRLSIRYQNPKGTLEIRDDQLHVNLP